MIGTPHSRALASPAELILTQVASHVIATRVLFDLGLAAWTKADVVFVLSGPLLKLFAHSSFTALVLTVPNVSTIETHLCFALRALKFLNALVSGSHMHLTSCLGAPPY